MFSNYCTYEIYINMILQFFFQVPVVACNHHTIVCHFEIIRFVSANSVFFNVIEVKIDKKNVIVIFFAVCYKGLPH